MSFLYDFTNCISEKPPRSVDPSFTEDMRRILILSFPREDFPMQNGAGS